MTKKFDLNIKVDEKNLTNTFGKFVIQPMDRGYGITIGNALRRVLLLAYLVRQLLMQNLIVYCTSSQV